MKIEELRDLHTEETGIETEIPTDIGTPRLFTYSYVKWLENKVIKKSKNPNAFSNVIGQWVSVKDRLPKSADYYLVSMNGKAYRMFFSTCATPTWYDNAGDIKEVQAWMPMPKPIDA